MSFSKKIIFLIGFLSGGLSTFFLFQFLPVYNIKNACNLKKSTIKVTQKFNNYSRTFKVGEILQQAYSDLIIGVTSDYIIWYDFTFMSIDDSISEKTFEELLNIPDIEDQFHFTYDIGIETHIPKKYSDPGRIRNDEFFKKMYGSTEEEVKKNLVEITWLPKTLNEKLLVTKINNINKKLQSISNELDTMCHLHKYLKNVGGTFNWRKIAGTNRQSPHSYGFAIDINTKFANYWKWDLGNVKTDSIKYVNRIPLEIIAIFEKHGFIWGGKWYHYDTMHFEYRPEMLIRKNI